MGCRLRVSCYCIIVVWSLNNAHIVVVSASVLHHRPANNLVLFNAENGMSVCESLYVFICVWLCVR